MSQSSSLQHGGGPLALSGELITNTFIRSHAGYIRLKGQNLQTKMNNFQIYRYSYLLFC